MPKFEMFSPDLHSIASASMDMTLAELRKHLEKNLDLTPEIWREVKAIRSQLRRERNYLKFRHQLGGR